MVIDLLGRLDDTNTDDAAFRSRTLDDVAAETDRMARMVRQLLILARADADATIEPRTVRLGEVLEAACRQGERMTDGVTFVPAPDGALNEAVVHGDADHLQQVVLILLDNAFKYTPCRPRTPTGSTAAATAPPPPAPDSAWPSPAGWPNNTTAASS